MLAYSVMKRFLLIVPICICLYGTQNVYANGNDIYFNMKYGTYECTIDNKECVFSRYEGGAESKGVGCPKRETFQEYITEMDKLIKSPNCKYFPVKIKKYICNYGTETGTIYMEDGKVIQASGTRMHFEKMQDRYQPDKCKQVEMK